MRPPESILESVARALEGATGHRTRIRSTRPVGGGCISPSARLETDDGDAWFLKWNAQEPVSMFEAEADGLRALASGAAATEVSVPQVVEFGGAGSTEKPGWLLMEFIPQGSPAGDYGRRLGEGLARLHQVSDGEPYGWKIDNFIGSLPQKNAAAPDWPGFWRDRRIGPQLHMARSGGYFRGGDGDLLDRLMDRMEDLLPRGSCSGPSLLHGDLWSGNYYSGPRGNPVLIDPAVYRGHGEVDLAMMELFGGLPRGFREAYGGREGIPDAYDALRRDLYQLYYLLVHVNLFGGGYVNSSLSAARRALAGV